ncbi:lipid kinase [Cellvibrio sp. ARAG 10.3]|uniref:lipid kinase n=1 Tax=Cellvibrio sp. ARAG 10.3 TaxID=3451358 RepID=UPI003F44A576
MTNTLRTALLIVNPNSRSGSDADIQEGIALLEAAGIQLINTTSNSAEQTRRLIVEHCRTIDLVILGGGDGTISSAAPTLYQHQLPFAILPLGTANDLARSLGMSGDLLEAFQLIVKNHRSRMNLGVVNGHYFFNAANIGLGVRVTHELTPEIKKQWGVFSYLAAVFAALKKNRKFRATIRVDGKPYKVSSIQLAVGNGRYYGGGNVIDEYSTIDDGKLCLYSVPPLTLWELLTLAPLLRNGKQRLTDKIFTASGQHIEINTSRLREIHADGEPVSITPALFEVIPEALEVIRPQPDEVIP